MQVNPHLWDSSLYDPTRLTLAEIRKDARASRSHYHTNSSTCYVTKQADF